MKLAEQSDDKNQYTMKISIDDGYCEHSFTFPTDGSQSIRSVAIQIAKSLGFKEEPRLKLRPRN